MKKNSEYFKFLSLGLFIFIAVFFFPSVIPVKIASGINDSCYWYTYFFSRKYIKPLKIVAIAIDEYSLSKIEQRWPWRRFLYAKLIEVLDKEQVNTVGFDLVLRGESDIREDDDILVRALKNVKSRVVLAAIFDPKTKLPILPYRPFLESCYAAGMVDTPADKDGRVRRMRSSLWLEDRAYPSFTVSIAAAFLNRSPEEIIARLPLLKDKSTFLINYLVRPKDILTLSFYAVLEDLAGLRAKYGGDFLKGALVLVYPQAEIIHDIHLTPFGSLPGGILNINGIADIVLGRFLQESRVLSLIFPLVSFFLIFYFLQYFGFLQGLFLTLGLFFAQFWLLVILSLKGIKFDYAQAVIFAAVFFAAGSLYKYLSFLSRLLKIKDKVTLDPLKGLFTLRYFYYRLELEHKRFYFGRDLFLAFIYLKDIKAAAERVPLAEIKDLWKKVHSLIALRKSCWSAYSAEEITGLLLYPEHKIQPALVSLKNNLSAIFKEGGIESQVRLGYLKFKKDYPVKELLFVLSRELKKQEQEITLFKDKDIAELLGAGYAAVGAKEEDLFLESIDADIEEKNRQLLSLLESLQLEHRKTKEAFFQIITSLVNALEARDPYTQGHSQRVSNYAASVAEKLGWGNEEKEKLKKACLLHDLGKIGIPDSVLHKKGQLTEEEFDFIRKHEIIGIRILEPLKEMAEILPWILYHHERWDGKGYPHGLAGNSIPEAAQVISLADVFDALTTGRDYKVAFSYEEAIKEMNRNKGTQFNPRLIDIFTVVVSEIQSSS